MKLQHQKFADAYLRLNSGTKAAIEAGYSKKTARVKASQLLCIEEVELYIEQQRIKLSEDAIVDAKWVQTRFKDISDQAYEIKDYPSSNKATEQLGKIIGVYIKDNDQKKTNIQLMQIDPLADNASNDSTT